MGSKDGEFIAGASATVALPDELHEIRKGTSRISVDVSSSVVDLELTGKHVEIEMDTLQCSEVIHSFTEPPRRSSEAVELHLQIDKVPRGSQSKPRWFRQAWSSTSVTASQDKATGQTECVRKHSSWPAYPERAGTLLRAQCKPTRIASEVVELQVQTDKGFEGVDPNAKSLPWFLFSTCITDSPFKMSGQTTSVGKLPNRLADRDCVKIVP